MSTALCGIHTPVGHYSLYLPLIDIKARATILASTSRTKLTQTFVNSSSTPLQEVKYVFPLYEGVSVVAFTCRVGDRTIVGEVKEREKAKQDFKEAVAAGRRAALFEEAREASDCFMTSVGNIPAGAKVEVNITYVSELKHDAEVDGIRFTIPAKILPRYGDYPVSLMPLNTANVNGKMDITVDVVLPRQNSIQKIQSPSHPISVNLGTTSVAPHAEPVLSKASASLGLASVGMEKDFILQVAAKDTGVPTAVLETHPTIPNQRALMATLVPRFALPADHPEIVFLVDRSGSMMGKPIELVKSALKVFLKSIPVGVRFNICSFGTHCSFLWPKSKAYNEETLDEALRHVQTMQANFHGTEMLKPFKDTIENRYRDLPLEILLLTDGEIWDQLKLFDLLNKHVAAATTPLRVFTLGIGSGVSHALIEGIARAGNGFSQAVSDGEKMDTKLIRMLKGAMSPHTTDYTLEVKYTSDIAINVDHQTSATRSDSDDEFVLVERVRDCLNIDTSKSDKGKGKIQLSRTPISFFDPSLDPDNHNTANHNKAPDATGERRYSHLPTVLPPKLMQAPHVVPPLFAFNRTTVYVLMGPECSRLKPTSIILRAQSDHGPLELEIPIEILEDNHGGLVHQLAAKRAITELEEGRGWLIHAQDKTSGELLSLKYESRFDEMVEREAVRLGVLFQIGGKWTSFVAVEKSHTEDSDADAADADADNQEIGDDEAERGMELEDEEGGKKDAIAKRKSTESTSPPVYHELATSPGSTAPGATPPQAPAPSSGSSQVRTSSKSKVSLTTKDAYLPSAQGALGDSHGTSGRDIAVTPQGGQNLTINPRAKRRTFQRSAIPDESEQDEAEEEGIASFLSHMQSQTLTTQRGLENQTAAISYHPSPQEGLSPGMLEVNQEAADALGSRVARSVTFSHRRPFASTFKASISSVANFMNLRSSNTVKAAAPMSYVSSPPGNMPALNLPAHIPSQSSQPMEIIHSYSNAALPYSVLCSSSRERRRGSSRAATLRDSLSTTSDGSKRTMKGSKRSKDDVVDMSQPRPHAHHTLRRSSANAMSIAPTLQGTNAYRPPVIETARKPEGDRFRRNVGENLGYLEFSIDSDSDEHDDGLDDMSIRLESPSHASRMLTKSVPAPSSTLSPHRYIRFRMSSKDATLHGEPSTPRATLFSSPTVPLNQQQNSIRSSFGSPANTSPTSSTLTLGQQQATSLFASATTTITPSSSLPPTLDDQHGSLHTLSYSLTNASTSSAPPSLPNDQQEASFQRLCTPTATISALPTLHTTHCMAAETPFNENFFTPLTTPSSSPYSLPPPPLPPPPPPAPAKSPLETLIDLQTFAGFWRPSSELASCLGLAFDTLQNARLVLDDTYYLSNSHSSSSSSDNNGNNNDNLSGTFNESDQRLTQLQLLLATALAIHYLETQLSNDKPTWELMVDKARAWLLTTLGQNQVIVETLMAKAEGMLST
ncbi:hypothetical protein DFQ26_008686 [Actinomortierella ambigua]|nr:hypothetical protein DFQ26_008686 [Actinomortierella ambigua]